MNRKAKIAYAHIIIGFVIFLVGLITILNHMLDDNELNSQATTSRKLALRKLSTDGVETDLGTKSRRVNLSNLLAPMSTSLPRRADYDEEQDVNVYINWYCEMRRQHRIQRDSGDESGDEKPTARNAILNSVLSFLICSTDTIYLVMLVCLALLGSLVLLYGCVRFYENDIKLLHQSLDDSANSGY